MNTFVRALYLLVVELVLAPFQLVALMGLYVYLLVKGMRELNATFVEVVKLTNTGMVLGAKESANIMVKYVKTGETAF